MVNVISSTYTTYHRFLPGLDIHIFPRVEQSERIKLESILTLVTENANRKFVAVTTWIECCPYKLDYADNSVLQFPRRSTRVNPTRGKLAKFHIVKSILQYALCFLFLVFCFFLFYNHFIINNCIFCYVFLVCFEVR